jgi:hypothetical protein
MHAEPASGPLEKLAMRELIRDYAARLERSV